MRALTMPHSLGAVLIVRKPGTVHAGTGGTGGKLHRKIHGFRSGHHRFQAESSLACFRRIEPGAMGDQQTHRFPQIFLRSGKFRLQHGLQKLGSRIAQAVHDPHGRGYKEIQRVGMYIVRFSINQRHPQICDLPAGKPCSSARGTAVSTWA